MMFVLILLYIQVIYSYNITVNINSSNIPKECLINYVSRFMSKSEILKIKEYNNREYYCNQDTDICTYTHTGNNAAYINFKDKEGKLKRYIIKNCNHADNITRCYGGEYRLGLSNEYAYCSFKCNQDSDCLYNKCINNVCVYNDESSIIACEDVYTRVYEYFTRAYVHCGKPDWERCSSHEECASKDCNLLPVECTTKECSDQKNDSYCHPNFVDLCCDHKDHNIEATLAVLIFLVIIIIVIIIFLCYKCICYAKKH